MYTKLRVSYFTKSVIIVDSFAYLQLYFTICKYTFTVTNEKKSWYPYNRQLDIVIDNGNFASLEDTF